MAKRKMTWEDSGFDCDHCGGEILKQAHQSIPEQQQYYQCSQCGCRWSVGGDMIRVGSGPFCQHKGYQRPSLPADKRIWWGIAIVGILLIFFRLVARPFLVLPLP